MRSDGSAVFDYVSPRWCELLDVTETETRRDSKAYLLRIHPDEVEQFVRLSEEARDTMTPFRWEGRILRKSGLIRWLHIESQPTRQENGDILWDGIQYDVTDRRMAEDALRITASVFDNSQEAIVITDANNVIIDVNPAFSHITGYQREEVLGRNPKFLSSGRQDQPFYAEMWKSLQEARVWRGEIWNRRKNGEVYAELLSISAICDETGQVQRHVGVFSDITYFKDHEAELSMVANYDALTGVPNRRLLADRLRQATALAQRGGKMLAICYIDLDGFKDVNDQHGHEAGDRLLVDIARRLLEVLRAGDTLARLGGDEFVVLFNDLAEEAECFQVLDRIMQTIAAPMQLAGQQVAVSASIGVTFYPSDNEDGDTLLRHADQAMYIAKQTGKNRYHIYDAIHDQRVRSLHETRRRIQQGLESGEFELYYQPKLELSSNKIVGVEALIRWNHPERGLLQPADFLPVIENSDLEIKLGKWVLGTALAQLHAWEQAGVALDISINISARHLQSPDFVAELKRRLEQYPKLEHGRLQIEVLETAALEDMGQSFEVIKSCREMGVSFALDDFGTGYSSLVYLRKLGADTLKIDQSFVQNMATNEGDRAIVQGVIALAKTFNRQTVAEGMEDSKLVQTLADMGCCFGQGYGIAYPMQAGEFLDWYKKR
jgi:diguanylate cyclase (GGDEF)-like protein/PAS domain S-box-containing protein